VTPVPVPVVVIGRPPVVVPAPPTLVVEATTTVTVAAGSDLGDGIASTGQTHHHRHRDKNSFVPDLTAAPARNDSTKDPRTGDEENDDDSLVSLLLSLVSTDKGN
jgi:hypothetical protein